MHVLLVGLGNMGSKYLKKLIDLNISPVLCDIDPSKMELCKSCPFYCHFGDVKEEVSKVIVAVDPEDHVTIAKEFLKKGIPVLLEKPPALSSVEFEEIWEDPNLEISEIELYSTAIRSLPKDIEVEEIDIVRFGKGRGYIDPFWDLAWHDLYLLQHLFGKVEVSKTKRDDVWEMEGSAGGIPFRLRVAWEHPDPRREWVLRTSSGRVFVDLMRDKLLLGKKVIEGKKDKLLEMVEDFLKGMRREGSTKRAMENIRILESLP